MPMYEFTRWSGRHEHVFADEVTFPAGVLVLRVGDRLVLAVRSGDWNDLREVVDAPPVTRSGRCRDGGPHLWVGRDGRPATGAGDDRCDSCGTHRSNTGSSPSAVDR